jgi:hypothetical protein
MRPEAERAIRAEHFSERMDLDVCVGRAVSDLLKKEPAGAGVAGDRSRKDLVLGHVCWPHMV